MLNTTYIVTFSYIFNIIIIKNIYHARFLQYLKQQKNPGRLLQNLEEKSKKKIV